MAALDFPNFPINGELYPATYEEGIGQYRYNSEMGAWLIVNEPSLVLPDTGVTVGTYTNATITVGADGRLSSASTGTEVLSDTGVTAGTYTNATITVGADGRVLSASTGTEVLSDTGVSAGTYANATIVVGADGRISFASTGASASLYDVAVRDVWMYS